MPQAVVTARVDQELSDKLDKLAAAQGRSRSWLTTRALENYVEQEGAFMAFLQEGVDAIDRGDVVDHSVIEADVALMRARVPAMRQS